MKTCFFEKKRFFHSLTLPARRHDSNTEKDRENGLRMNNEMTMKEKDLVFLPTRKKEKRKADPHLAHCLLPDTSQRFAKDKEPNLAYTPLNYIDDS